MKLGAPVLLMQVLGSVVIVSANHGAGASGGARRVAVVGVFNAVATLLVYPPLGVARALQSLVAFNRGAKVLRAAVWQPSMGGQLRSGRRLSPQASQVGGGEQRQGHGRCARSFVKGGWVVTTTQRIPRHLQHGFRPWPHWSSGMSAFRHLTACVAALKAANEWPEDHVARDAVWPLPHEKMRNADERDPGGRDVRHGRPATL
jgi:hypothetical protein